MNTTCKNQKFVFSENEYNSGDGMLTTVWGPGMWHYLHTMSFNYPVEPSKQDKNIIKISSCNYNMFYLVENAEKILKRILNLYH